MMLVEHSMQLDPFARAIFVIPKSGQAAAVRKRLTWGRSYTRVQRIRQRNPSA
ncbi:hypothetical protein [Paraburkholderia caffeinilytica]|uniref:hypothetical protein n=1 Tax=Paraburkholderia caffeinilytica TaxID=1761016 RepID=UPI003DA1A241